MHQSHRVKTVRATMAGLFAMAVAVAAVSFSPAVHSMSIGHSRLLSPVGQPLLIQTPVLGLTEQERASLTVTLAPVASWREAGLVPPVDLSSVQVAVVDGVRPGSRLVTIRSTQPLASNLADILLVVRSSSGQMQHQVSVLAPADLTVVSAAAEQVRRTPGAIDVGASPANRSAEQVIQVRPGDTLFALARRHAVPGVSLYQWMVAVQVANPAAFIRDNVNLLKAGATLVVPDQAALTALTDAQARRVFGQHAHAFAEYRQRLASGPGQALQATDTSAGMVSDLVTEAAAPAPSSGSDKVVLSAAPPAGTTNPDDALALQRNTQEAQERVATLEDNVRNLNEALEQQGAAASDAASNGVQVVSEAVGQAVDAVVSGLDPTNGAGSSSAAPEGSAAQARSEAAAAPASSGPTSAGPQGSAPSASGNGAVVSGPQALSPSASGNGAPASGSQASASSAASNSPSASGSQADAGASASLPSLSVPATPPGLPSTNEASLSSPSVAAPQSAPTNAVQPSKRFSFVNWFQDNLWAILAGIFAVVVAFIVWLLRRASADPVGGSGAITEEMVRERLQGINLDLDEPAADKTPPR